MADLRALNDVALHQHATVALREALKTLADIQADVSLGTALRSTIDGALHRVQDARDAIYEIRRRAGVTTRIRAQLADENAAHDPKKPKS